MRKALHILGNVAKVALVLLLCANLYLIAARLFFQQRAPSMFGFGTSVVLSGSMEPELYAGDLMIWHKQRSYEVGDIVMFDHGSGLLTHRIIGEGPEGYITKGDNNNVEDEQPLSSDKIHGVMIGVIPKLGHVMLFLRSPAGILLMIVIGAALLEGPRVIELILEKRKEKQNKTS